MGAPPDPFFTKGQDWGFAPLDPVASRRNGHRYFRACLRHQLEHCGLLRIDHVMGLHRVWCVPHGESADRGCYVRQPAEELFAILTLESRRHGCAVVGEDLGTVPDATRRALDRHGILSMHVLQFAVGPGRVRQSLEPAASCLVSVNTHDMPPFARFWDAGDVDDRVEMGLLDERDAARERLRRRRLRRALVLALESRCEHPPEDRLESVLAAVMRAFARSEAAIVQIGLEDLLGETRPQNVPGTGGEQPNWRRRARLALEQMEKDPRLRSRLGEIVRLRRSADHGR